MLVLFKPQHYYLICYAFVSSAKAKQNYVFDSYVLIVHMRLLVKGGGYFFLHTSLYNEHVEGKQI